VLSSTMMRKTASSKESLAILDNHLHGSDQIIWSKVDDTAASLFNDLNRTPSP
jgi:hypothetical protein